MRTSLARYSQVLRRTNVGRRTRPLDDDHVGHRSGDGEILASVPAMKETAQMLCWPKRRELILVIPIFKECGLIGEVLEDLNLLHVNHLSYYCAMFRAILLIHS